MPKITDLLKGIDMNKYRRRLDKVHGAKLTPLQLLALEIHVREELKHLGGDPDEAAGIMDYVDLTLTYDEAKQKVDERLSGADEARWITRSR